MLRMSWTTFRDHWPIFVGAVVSVCLGVALVQSSLLLLVSAATADAPGSAAAAEGYEVAITLLAMILGVSSFVAVFIVSSTFAFTVAQRRRDLALLRLTGAGRGQVRMLLLGEALLLGLLGSALGILFGLPVMRLETMMLDAFGFVPSGFAGEWRSWIVWVSTGTGVLVALCGVLAASRRASRIRPLEALRETGEGARVMTASRWVVGLLFAGGSVAMMAVVQAVGGEAALPISIFISFTLVIALAALAPLVVPLVSWPFGLLFRGRLGRLAHANLRAGVRRSAATAAPVMVLVGLVAGLSGTLATLTEGTRQESLRTIAADLVVTADRPVGAVLAGIDGVGTVSEEVPVPFQLGWDADDDVYDTTEGLAVDPAAYAATHRVAVTAGSLADLRDGTVALDPGYASEMGWQVGGALHVRLDGTPRDLRIVALLPDTLAGPYFLLPADTAPAGGARRYVVQVDGDVSTVAGRIGEQGLGVVTVDDWVRQTADDEQRTDIDIMAALLGMSTLYTVIAMVNAVVIAASDRYGEFATARVSGLTRGQVVVTALAESLAVVTVGVLLGLLAAAGTVIGIALAVRDMIGITVVAVQWPLLVALALGAAAVVGLTSVLTTAVATRTPPIRLVAARD